MATAEALLTAKEFAQMPPTGRLTELVRGRIIEMNPPGFRHGFLCARIARLLGNFVEEHKLGRVISNDSGVVTRRDPDSVRGPDAAYFSFQRLPANVVPDPYPEVAPELVFEVRSPSDRWSQVLEKTAEYLTAGVALVCVVDPVAETVWVFADHVTPITFAREDTLILPGVLEGFSLTVRALFE